MVKNSKRGIQLFVLLSLNHERRILKPLEEDNRFRMKSVVKIEKIEQGYFSLCQVSFILIIWLMCGNSEVFVFIF